MTVACTTQNLYGVLAVALMIMFETGRIELKTLVMYVLEPYIAWEQSYNNLGTQFIIK